MTSELELLQSMNNKLDEQAKKEIENSKEFKQAKDELEAQKKANQVLQTRVDEVVKENTDKGATIIQLQDEVKNIAEKVKDIQAKGGRPSGGKREVKTMFAEVADAVEEHKQQFIDMLEKKTDFKPIKLEQKASNISSSSNSANYLQYLPWQPGMEPIGQDRFRDLVPIIQSSEDFVQYPRANSPVGAGSFNRQTEAAAKQQVDRGYTMVSLTLKPMAGYAICSRQSLRNIPFLQSWLPASMLEQLMDSEDTDFANALVSAATGSTTTSNTVKIEKIIDYIKNLRKVKQNPNFVALDPDTWGAILITKPNDYSLPNVVTIDANGTVKILGRPVTAANWLTGGRCIVGDSRKAAIVQSEGLTLRQTDSHASTFTTNEITFLLERTEGLAIFRTEAFVTSVV